MDKDTKKQPEIKIVKDSSYYPVYNSKKIIPDSSCDIEKKGCPVCGCTFIRSYPLGCGSAELQCTQCRYSNDDLYFYNY
jgi:hypothetical protein